MALLRVGKMAQKTMAQKMVFQLVMIQRMVKKTAYELVIQTVLLRIGKMAQKMMVKMMVYQLVMIQPMVMQMV